MAGREFSREAVAAAARRRTTRRPSTRGTPRRLVQKGLAERGPAGARPPEAGFRFHHVLIHDAAYGTVPKASARSCTSASRGWLDEPPDPLGGADRLPPGTGPWLSRRARDGERPRDAARGRCAARACPRRACARPRAATCPRRRTCSRAAVALIDAAELAHRDLLTELGLVALEKRRASGGRAALRDCDRDGNRGRRPAGRAAGAHRAREPEAPPRRGGSLGRALVAGLGGDSRPRGARRRPGARPDLVRLATTYGGFSCQYRKASEAAERALACFRRSDWPLNPCLMELAAGLYYGPTPVPEAIRRSRALLAEADRGGGAQVLAVRRRPRGDGRPASTLRESSRRRRFRSSRTSPGP